MFFIEIATRLNFYLFIDTYILYKWIFYNMYICISTLYIYILRVCDICKSLSIKLI